MNTYSRIYIIKVLLSVLFFTPVLGIAQDTEEEVLTAREFLADCEKPTAASKPTQACMRFIFGLVQTVVMMQQQSEGGAMLFCIDPNAISLEEVTDTVTAWLEKVPERHDEEAYILVSEALNESYPCSKSKII